MGSHEPAADSSAARFICLLCSFVLSITTMSGGSSVRAAKSGFAAQAQAKLNSKYSESYAQEVLEWMRKLTGEPSNVSGDPENVYELLRDGTLLCRLVNEIQPAPSRKCRRARWRSNAWKILTCFSRLPSLSECSLRNSSRRSICGKSRTSTLSSSVFNRSDARHRNMESQRSDPKNPRRTSVTSLKNSCAPVNL